jgi:septal ring factor EnvC (AmiA/AmiB activator)
MQQRHEHEQEDRLRALESKVAVLEADAAARRDNRAILHSLAAVSEQITRLTASVGAVRQELADHREFLTELLGLVTPKGSITINAGPTSVIR